MLLKQSGDIPSSIKFSENLLRSRSGMRLAMRANHWLPPLVPRREQYSSSRRWKNENSAGRQAEPGYQMEALVPLETAEDDAWLNDVAPPRPKPSPVPSTPAEEREQQEIGSSNDATWVKTPARHGLPTEQQEIGSSNDATGKTTPSTTNEYSLLCWL